MILKENINASPLLYLGGVSAVNLGFLLDYIYHGEVNLFQEQLDSFLESAQKLEIEGLMGEAEEMQVVRINEKIKATTQRQYARQPTTDVVKIEAEEKIAELYEKVDNVWRCLACEYTTTGRSSNVRRHVETHINGLSYSCNLCNKEFRLSNSLSNHKSTVHKN